MLLDPLELIAAERPVDEPREERIDGGMLRRVQMNDASGHAIVPTGPIGNPTGACDVWAWERLPRLLKSLHPIIPSQTETKAAYSPK
jgi:hypothetical protein